MVKTAVRAVPAALLAVLAIGPVGPAHADIVMYPGSAPCDTTLQACIDGVASGTTIQIDTNTAIDESLSISKSLTLQPASGFHPVIGGTSTQRVVGVSQAQDNSATSIELDGLTFKNATVQQNFMAGTGHSFTVRDSTIESNQATNAGVAVQVASSVPATLAFVGNHVSSQGEDLTAFAEAPAGQDVQITVADNVLTSPRPKFSQDGMRIQPTGGGTATIDLQDNVVHDVAGCNCGTDSAVVLVPGGSEQATINMVHDTVVGTTHGGTGVDVLEPQGTSRLTLNLFDDLVDRISGPALRLDAPGANHHFVFHSGHDDIVPGGQPNELNGHSLGPGTLHVDPQLVDPAAGNFRLKSTSPLINAGLACQPGKVRLTDADGNFRAAGLETDIGAYEFGSGPPGPGVVLFGTGGADTLTGTNGRDIICGLGGADHLSGAGGGDFIDGGTGDDVFSGGDGNDAIHGGPGADTISGGAGRDHLFGGPGDDPCLVSKDGVKGNDSIDGGPGNDGFRADPGDHLTSVEHAC